MSKRLSIKEILEVTGMSAYDLMREAKKMCRCGTCKFFEQHYDKHGNSVDWGHCFKSNRQRQKSLGEHPCGGWEPMD